MNDGTPRTARTDGTDGDVETASGPPGQGSTQTQDLHTYRLPQWVLARFVARRTAQGAILWGAVMGLYVYASTVGFTDLAPTPAGRQQFLAALAGNTGLKAMFGVPYRIDTVGGFVTWRATGVMSLVGALWGLLVATRVTRGEEAAGRWEPFLAGRTTHRRAAAQALAGLACSLLLMLAIVTAVTTAVGMRSNVGFGLGRSFLFALAITAGAAEFVVVGTLAAQIMPIRARAASLAAGVFGVAFLLRAIADIAAQAHWLGYLSPLGWVEQVRALSDPQPVWLLPIGVFVAAGTAGTVWLAGRRDLGASTWADKDAKEPRTGLLGSHQLLAVRLSRTSAISWVETLYTVFRGSGIYHDMVSRKSRCVTVNYAGEFHMDVVPYLDRHGQRYITNRHDNAYELTNPEAFNAWLDEQNRITSGRLVKVIRLLKYLRDFKNNFSVKSVILTILLGERISTTALLADPNHYADLPATLLNLMTDLNEYLQANPSMPSIDDPSCPTENFNHRWSQEQYANLRNWIATYTGWAKDAYFESDRDASYTKWRKLLGNEFGTYTINATKASQAHKGRSGVDDTEEFIDKRFPVALNQTYRVKLTARTVRRDGFRTFSLGDWGNKVSKQRKITFSIASINVPAPYDIYWKVRNGGEEAIKANMIRGQIQKDDGSRSRTEPTAYAGNHYVEVYIVKDGVVVTKDHHTVIIS